MAPAAADQLQVMASGFTKLMVSQVATRLVTFCMNLLVARQLSPEAYGLSAVQFHLITTSILFLSREGFRRGGLRIQEEQSSKESSTTVAERVLRVSWPILPIGMVLSTAVCGFVLWHSAAQGGDLAYQQAVVAHGVAAVLELASEPLYIISSTRLEFGRRAGIETAAMITKCGVTLLLVLGSSLQPALVFGASQLAFSCVVLGGYMWYGAQLWAQGQLKVHSWRLDSQDRQTLAITGLFSIQAAEKLLLAEGSKLALVGFESSYNQGVYGLVANLGSLVVRLLFTPVEEAAFTAFSRAGLRAAAEPASRGPLASVLAVAVKAVALLGLLAVTFGPCYSYTLLRMVYGQRWSESEAPFVLGCYTAYLLLLAVNGITEAFVHAVLEPSALKAANALLVVFTAAHVLCSIVLVKAGGAAGLVLADTVNMSLRIAFSLWYIRRYFSEVPGFSIRQLLPSSQVLLACCIVSGCLAASNTAFMAPQQLAAHGFWRQAALHVAVGVGCLGVLAMRIVKVERATIAQVSGLRHKQE
ncbi:hypothetical protein OEZ85_012938 [Tetradesmus obliquus]|uniref:Protein RFT1 homolog n=1 Tax=Tetradesmus obliquus TaxID=3088 RepID=A0ABY8U4P4_TETOB|nr:hypothetical protein OEZ85_012938 [Tetradesmus obliquus]